jgi:hypothetical protein
VRRKLKTQQELPCAIETALALRIVRFRASTLVGGACLCVEAVARGFIREERVSAKEGGRQVLIQLLMSTGGLLYRLYNRAIRL